VALNKKRASKAKKDGLGEDDPAWKKAQAAKVKAAKVKVAKTTLDKAKANQAKPVKAPKKRAGSLVGESIATVDSGKQQTRRKIRDRGAGKPNEAGGTVALELDPLEVARKNLKGSVPAIVKAMVQLAKQGSCSHAKTLLEMTGAKHMFDGDAEAQGSGEPWAKLVLERLDEAESEAEQETERLRRESVLVAE
jgi:hypothetical protein